MRVKLEAYNEQGSEGTHWSVWDPSKSGYEGLHPLKEGDYLNIPNLFSGHIKYDKYINRVWPSWANEYILADNYKGLLQSRLFYKEDIDYKQECIELYTVQYSKAGTCHWLQKDVNPNLWAQWFLDELDAEFYPRGTNINMILNKCE